MIFKLVLFNAFDLMLLSSLKTLSKFYKKDIEKKFYNIVVHRQLTHGIHFVDGVHRASPLFL